MPTVAVGLLHSLPAGIVTLVVFLVYQQVENHILNPVVMSRTVRLNPLWVLLAILVGVELGGIVGSTLGGLVGALLAVPAASAIQVIARELWTEHRLARSEGGPAPDGGVAVPIAPSGTLGRSAEPCGSSGGDVRGAVTAGWRFGHRLQGARSRCAAYFQ